ncbi:hypothetical protein HYH03_015504 [Edaphochlamys debaryana]|uniref:Macro domain-containing protein n=1 Tax=Edaphochlamys debaryana TaxID=47281 RepID=A0A835XKJ6_9CHLO|nr:hypothetical protein HYH03_015504 [Edaphochlamys debaryana]|eukprot:KAG2485793.1 hypothetical protein HYH03_015504 [Edaphochlamys debaryana]
MTDYIIHTCGPVYAKEREQECERDLTNAYRNSLNKAQQLGVACVAFAAISTGVYAYPFRDATKVSLTVLKDARPPVQEVWVVLFTQGDFDTATGLAEELGLPLYDPAMAPHIRSSAAQLHTPVLQHATSFSHPDFLNRVAPGQGEVGEDEVVEGRRSSTTGQGGGPKPMGFAAMVKSMRGSPGAGGGGGGGGGDLLAAGGPSSMARASNPGGGGRLSGNGRVSNRSSASQAQGAAAAAGGQDSDDDGDANARSHPPSPPNRPGGGGGLVAAHLLAGVNGRHGSASSTGSRSNAPAPPPPLPGSPMSYSQLPGAASDSPSRPPQLHTPNPGGSAAQVSRPSTPLLNFPPPATSLKDGIPLESPNSAALMARLKPPSHRGHGPGPVAGTPAPSMVGGLQKGGGL